MKRRVSLKDPALQSILHGGALAIMMSAAGGCVTSAWRVAKRLQALLFLFFSASAYEIAQTSDSNAGREG